MNLTLQEIKYIINRMPLSYEGVDITSKLTRLIKDKVDRKYKVLFTRGLECNPEVSSEYYSSLAQFKISKPTLIGLQLLESTCTEDKIICYTLVPEYVI